MRLYLRYVPEFVLKILQRADAWGSVAIMVIVALAYFGIRNHALPPPELGVAIAVFGFFEGAYGVFKAERQQRAAREESIRLSAQIASMSANIPDPGPDKTSLSVRVVWEVWCGEDVNTDRIALNLIYQYERRWWQPWKKTRFPQTGIPRNGHSDTQYRVTIKAGDPQPFRGEGVFEYVADRHASAGPHWLLELVLVLGRPHEERRIPVALDWDELHNRGTFPPL